MTSSQADTIYKDESTIVNDLLTAMVARIPDLNLSPESIFRMLMEVYANQGSGFFLALQLYHDDLFIQSMSSLALQAKGTELGRPQKVGALASGTVTFSGAGGTFIAQGSEVGAPRLAVGDVLTFATSDDCTIPNPGIPTAPTAVDHAVAGNITGTIQYVVTFVTAGGETTPGEASDALTGLSATQVSLSTIPLGGDGTTARKLYRSKNGGAYAFVHTIADNVTTTYVDNVADGSLGAAPLATSTAERIDCDAQATDPGIAFNVGTGAITSLVNVDGDVTGVTNAASFTGGTDSEAIEVFRQALLQWSQSPGSGSMLDLIALATSIDGIDAASVFKNVNLDGDAELGSVVVRVSGTGGSIPDDDLVDQVEDLLNSKTLGNITIYVGTFTPVDVGADPGVEVDIEVLDGYDIEAVTPSVQAAIAAYVNAIAPGGTMFVAGVIDSTFGLPGVRTLTVVSPTDDVDSADTEKLVLDADDVVVNEEDWS